jgi:hypothetical protein
MMEHNTIGDDARAMLLEQKKIQDEIAALAHHIPSVLYVLTTFVYTPLMFIVRDTLLYPVWIAFSVQLIVVWLVFSVRALMSFQTQKFYEMVVLRKPSDSRSTVEMMWGDRLAELRQYTRYQRVFVLFGTIEPLLWLCFAGMVYSLARSY